MTDEELRQTALAMAIDVLKETQDLACQNILEFANRFYKFLANDENENENVQTANH